jgi:hypothetical protein
VVPEKYRDGDGHPLLRCLGLNNVWHVSEMYQRRDLGVMRTIGTSDLDGSEFLYHVAGDLKASKPRVQTMESHDWQTKLAHCLIEELELKKGSAAQFLKKLALIPLDDGTWLAPNQRNIYFPTVDGIQIPTDLDLTLVESSSLEIPSRKQLFALLGVQDCSPATVFQSITEQYRRGGVYSSNSMKHIEFLFWHHDKLPVKGIGMKLFPSWGGGIWFSPTDETQGWTYCPQSTEKYSMAQLLGPIPVLEMRDHMKYPSQQYYQSLQKLGKRNNREAVEWFNEFLQACQTPQICQRKDKTRRSMEVEIIAREKPEFLLGVLRANWIQYRSCDDWDNYFKSVEIPILDSDYSELREIEDTYLPLPKLRNIVHDLNLESGFGFIKELENIDNIDVVTWNFLERFGVGIDDDVKFWITLLEQAYEADVEDEMAISKIYTRLQTFVDADEIKKIRQVSNRRKLPKLMYMIEKYSNLSRFSYPTQNQF